MQEAEVAALEAKLFELKRQKALELARSDFESFIRWVKPDYRMQWYHRRVARSCQAVADGRGKRIIINMPPRHGKLCSNSTPVLTPQGWKTHGELQPGDEVFHPSGTPTKIVACTAPDVADMLVTLTDGAAVKVHANHEWTVYDRKIGAWRTYETREMVDAWIGVEGQRGSRARYQLPLVEPLQFPHADLVMEPYALGAWLGDGTSDKPYITHPERDSVIAEHIEALGYKRTKVYRHKTTGVLSSSFAGEVRGGKGGHFWQEMRALNLVRNKHIPAAYQRASVHQRLQLLAGLIDTDGYTEANGRVRFSNTNKRLADDVAQLARGLGSRVTITRTEPKLSSSGIQGRKTVYQVCFNPILDVPCQVPRKRLKHLSKRRRVAIRSVVPCTPEPGKCITVDSPDGLYLVGRHLTPTHNSEEVSRLFPAYVLGIDPNRRIIATSYSAELASWNNRDVQRIIDSETYREVFPNTTLAATNSRAVAGRALRNSDVFEIVDHRGVYRSAGVGGSVMGMGGDLILVDDPIKNEEEARSPIFREKLWQWYTNTLLTRKQAGASIFIIMTRWHEDDLVGRLLQRAAEDPNADQWELICFRAIRENDDNPDDPRAEGEALWPDEYPVEDLEKTRASMGETGFAGLFQQRPSLGGKAALPEHRWCYWYTGKEPPPVMVKDDEGNLVECHQERLPEHFDYQYQTWDMAFKDLKTSDWVVGQVHARKQAKHFLLDQIRARLDFPATLRALHALTAEHPQTRKKLIEDKANGPAVMSSAHATVPGMEPVNPEGGKEARVNGISYLHEGGNLFIPHPSEKRWVRAFVLEAAQFPRGQYDDQVDAYSQGVNWSYHGKRKKKWGKVRVVESRW